MLNHIMIITSILSHRVCKLLDVIVCHKFKWTPLMPKCAPPSIWTCHGMLDHWKIYSTYVYTWLESMHWTSLNFVIKKVISGMLKHCDHSKHLLSGRLVVALILYTYWDRQQFLGIPPFIIISDLGNLLIFCEPLGYYNIFWDPASIHIQIAQLTPIPRLLYTIYGQLR